LPEFFATKGRYYHDLDSRIACIRECFEETNILLSKKPVETPDLRETLEKDCGGNFLKFAQKFSIEPAVDQLVAHLRIGPPFGEEAQTTTQFYLCFDSGKDNKVMGCDIKLQASEFVEHSWLSVKSALDLYEHKKLDLWPP
jgi:8-oxo-dGTP pyrophosphatase MutT (NUDIX family)